MVIDGDITWLIFVQPELRKTKFNFSLQRCLSAISGVLFIRKSYHATKLALEKKLVTIIIIKKRNPSRKRDRSHNLETIRNGSGSNVETEFIL